MYVSLSFIFFPSFLHTYRDAHYRFAFILHAQNHHHHLTYSLPTFSLALPPLLSLIHAHSHAHTFGIRQQKLRPAHRSRMVGGR